MSDYIEREAAKNILLQHQHRFTCADEANGYGSVKWSEDVIYLSEAVNGMDAIPAADVRPVVLCKGCRNDRHCMIQDFMEDCGITPDVQNNFFCGYGEREDS